MQIEHSMPKICYIIVCGCYRKFEQPLKRMTDSSMSLRWNRMLVNQDFFFSGVNVYKVKLSFDLYSHFRFWLHHFSLIAALISLQCIGL